MTTQTEQHILTILTYILGFLDGLNAVGTDERTYNTNAHTKRYSTAFRAGAYARNELARKMTRHET